MKTIMHRWSVATPLAAMLAIVVLFVLHSAINSAEALDPEAIIHETNTSIRNMICPGATFTFAELGDAELNRMDPARIFDNLYMLGMKSTSAWALTTSEGIILFEAMFDYTVEDNVVDYLVQLGLDPADIRYVIVGHAHVDHFGGARYLQDTYGARIVMSVEEWEHMRSSQRIAGSGPPSFPRADIAVRDGDTITLGDTSVRLIHTPGHTPGTLSSIFVVRDGDEQHHVGYLGGSGVPSSVEGILAYMGSVERLARIDSRVDVALSNHPFIDGSLLKRDALAQRESGGPHPFVQGNAEFRHWLSVINACAGDVLEQSLSEEGGG